MCKSGHRHDWPIEGEITIERCETVCQLCPQGKPFVGKFAWFLRRHVEQVHCGKDFPNLRVAKGWTGAENGNEKGKRREKKLKKRAATTPPPPAFVTPAVTPMPITPPQTVQAVADDEQYLQFFDEDAAVASIEPSLLLTSDYMSVSTWTMPQTIRTDSQPIDSSPPLMAYAGGPDKIISGLNNLIGEVQFSGTMTEQETLYMLENYVEAFKAGRAWF